MTDRNLLSVVSAILAGSLTLAGCDDGSPTPAPRPSTTTEADSRYAMPRIPPSTMVDDATLMANARVLQEYVSAARDDCQRMWELTREDFRSSPEAFCQTYASLVRDVDLSTGTLEADGRSGSRAVRLELPDSQVIALLPDAEGVPRVSLISLTP
ncbi:hypothetical protein GCM10009821_28330 [Aeromicrobium halocynthiae]|uniref:Uncharacterized protein n=1 Tax=Aeromicrobium halocynthiae TaxID=560557 RepID=A0ABN2W7E0_9ACTN